MTLKTLLRRERTAFTPEELRSKAIARVRDSVEASRTHAWCCPTCLKFCSGQPLTSAEKAHIEEAIRYQEQLIVAE